MARFVIQPKAASQRPVSLLLNQPQPGLFVGSVVVWEETASSAVDLVVEHFVGKSADEVHQQVATWADTRFGTGSYTVLGPTRSLPSDSSG